MKKFTFSFVIKGILVFMLSFIITFASTAQHIMLGSDNLKVEVGLNFGPTFFLGDLGGHRGIGTTFIKDINLPITRYMKGLFLSVSPNDWLGFRIAAEVTYVEGNDNLISTKGPNETYRKDRNLDFRSNIEEAYAAVEIYPLMLLNKNNSDYQPRLRPYLFAGAGVFHFNPQGSITDANGNKTWHYLQPLHTEGEGFAEYPNRHNYALTQLNIPMGGGLKYLLSEKTNIGIELLYRKTFTDYIDDVSTTYINRDLFNKYLSPADANIAIQLNDKSGGTSVTRTEAGSQRGNPKNYDTYFSFVLKLGIKLSGKYGNEYNRDVAKGTRCPARF